MRKYSAAVLALIAALSMWFYVDVILVGRQVQDAIAQDRPRGNLSDLYPRWLGARELLLHGRNPYSPELTVEIQQGYYGRAIDPSRPNDPTDRQAFAYPVYVVFLLAPLIGLPFQTVHAIFFWLLIGLSAASVLLWLRALRWKPAASVVLVCIAFTLGSIPFVQAIKLQQLSLVVAALLAASAASIAGGWLFLGGALLALATIKPQLAWPPVAWGLLWCICDWRARWRAAFGFAAVLLVLFAGSEWVLPGWWRMFLEGLRRYHTYTQNQSVLDETVNWLLGSYAGTVLAGLATLLSVVLLWTRRHAGFDSEEFGGSVALVLALTVLIVPMYAPYNQVLLLPAILWLGRNRRAMLAASRRVWPVFAAGALALAWQWLASVLLSAAYLAGFQAAALASWKAPFYGTFVFPVIVFFLMAVGVRHQSAFLRGSRQAE